MANQQISSDGVQMMRFDISGWSNPLDYRFGGTKIAIVTNIGTTYWDAGTATSLGTPWQPGVSAQDITFYFLSYNSQHQVNSILPGFTPSKTIHFKPTP